MRILGIDYGDIRIGIAVSDPFGWTAQAVETITYTDISKALDRLREIIKEYNPEKIVIGYPINMNGTVGPRGEKTESFITLLKNIFTEEIIKWDERLSTVSAENLLIESNMRREKRKKVIDTVAATYILQSYLNFNQNKNHNKI